MSVSQIAQDSPSPGRKGLISREDIIDAALTLLGPNRSVSTLSLREVARAADIAPNSFYRQFRDMDELAVALIDLAGESLRRLIGAARQRATTDRGVVRGSVEVFMEQLRSDDRLLHILLREGTAGSDAFKRAAERQLNFFEEELKLDLIRLSSLRQEPLHEPALVAKAITRLAFALGATAIDLPDDKQAELSEQLIVMVRMIMAGAQAMEKTRAAS